MEFVLTNLGVWPVDVGSPVGQFRLLYGDAVGVELDPPVEGFRGFSELSDSEIEVFLAQGDDSVSRAIGTYYLALSGRAAAESKSVKDYDLALDLTKRAGDLRATALLWFERADEEDARAGVDEWFDVVSLGDRVDWIPEGAPVMWGRAYGPRRWL